jgi:hypothetical protein
MLGKLKVLDAYPKINEDFFTKTFSGGIITIVSSIIMVLLFLSELGEPRGGRREQGRGEHAHALRTPLRSALSPAAERARADRGHI